MGTYSAKDLQVLEGLEPVRRRPGMYIGSTTSTGLHHLVWEILDNCVDEALNGHCDIIEITLENFEPRIDNVSVEVEPRPDTNEFEVTVFFNIVGQDIPTQEFTFMLEATR